ncbi:hypothetical protein M3J09_007171 [Ascochyta lentis]
MPQPPNPELLSREDRILFALQAIKCDASLSIRRAAAIYNVPRSTLGDRRAGMTAQRDLHPSRANLSKHEEEVLIQQIRKLNARGFAPTLQYVQDMANQLLAVRDGERVGNNWVSRLVSRRTDIKSQVTRLRDRQRVLCSNPAIISP